MQTTVLNVHIMITVGWAGSDADEQTNFRLGGITKFQHFTI
jgi:hypothetical protein